MYVSVCVYLRSKFGKFRGEKNGGKKEERGQGEEERGERKGKGAMKV